MKQILAFNGSPRPSGNTSYLLQQFLEGAMKNNADVSEINPLELDIKYCQGCLRCNILKRCSLRDDDWEATAASILAADVLVFATPVYFHHLPAPLKTILDRFRSFVHVQMTETSLIHTPWHEWNKEFVLILTMGSSDQSDADPIIDLFRFITSIMGEKNRLHIITATRLGLVKQVVKSEAELLDIYKKLDLPDELAKDDATRNKNILAHCRELGIELSMDKAG